jgi:hypothetical protein
LSASLGKAAGPYIRFGMFLRNYIIAFGIYALVAGVSVVVADGFGLPQTVPVVLVVFVAPALVALLFAGLLRREG